MDDLRLSQAQLAAFGFPYLAGMLWGMPVVIDPKMPDDRIRFVDRVTGQSCEFTLPPNPSTP